MERINKEQWNDEVTKKCYQINLATNLPRKISKFIKVELLKMKYRHVLYRNLDGDTSKIENFRSFVLPSLADHIYNDNDLKRYPCRFTECLDVGRDHFAKRSLLQHLVEKHDESLPNNGQFLLRNWDTDAAPQSFLCMDFGLEFRRKDKYSRHLQTMTHITNSQHNKKLEMSHGEEGVASSANDVMADGNNMNSRTDQNPLGESDEYDELLNYLSLNKTN
ncbi:hypothetical protein BpHYR1_043240 [Brachionus plicatilis]|uniref:Uncharacterized protein n=1 Tax=Brachionus plicatilis TaxID=10195 RepID=A0A3M7R325_BRAPC|nr:hypothetical protein BpHYR1_043240 [Brachionus plicatilis]